ncbi:MAG TPA: SIMPL domain-containing protein [Candidatus Angelobacter sp.]|nr:SIMPL domain-containing protein [Candidatus Angelobacter sp.]
MNTRIILCALIVVSTLGLRADAQQSPEVKFVADTLVVQAEGSYESDPDLAILAFDVSAQEKELKEAYSKASQSMRTIVSIAERNGLGKDSIQTGVLTVTPFYSGDRNRKARAYRVQGRVVLKVQDFAKIGPLIDDSVQEGIVDFRSLTYALANEEAAKQKAVADAMHRAVGRATVALEQTKQKLGPARSVNLEVRNLVGIAQIAGLDYYSAAETTDGTTGGLFAHKKVAAPPPPPVQPGKITISATVQCVFGIER